MRTDIVGQDNAESAPSVKGWRARDVHSALVGAFEKRSGFSPLFIKLQAWSRWQSNHDSINAELRFLATRTAEHAKWSVVDSPCFEYESLSLGWDSLSTRLSHLAGVTRYFLIPKTAGSRFTLNLAGWINRRRLCIELGDGDSE